MRLRDTKSLTYAESDSDPEDTNTTSPEIGPVLDALADQAVKERRPGIDELETRIMHSMDPEGRHPWGGANADAGESPPLIKTLKDSGYLRDGKDWMTKKAFEEIGERMIRDTLRNLEPSDFGPHHTRHPGYGSTAIETTRRLEPGDDAGVVNAQQTVLNAIMRAAGRGSRIVFPIDVEPEDVEVYETLRDASSAVVYCIDLSSTMKARLGRTTRMETAKRALWGLHALYRKFFPGDSLHIVGFASLASSIRPLDIPALRTYDANDGFLHYTNYQAALRASRKILARSRAQNRRIVLITDGQPSACFVETESEKDEILSAKPYANFYHPEEEIVSRINKERRMDLDSSKMVYLCYRYKKVDPKVAKQTLIEAKRCIKAGIGIDQILVSDEEELLQYAKDLEAELKGRTYQIVGDEMEAVLTADYMSNTRRVFRRSRTF